MIDHEDQSLIQLGQPTIDYDDDQLTFYWKEYALQSIVARLTDEGKCEQSVYQGVDPNRLLIYFSEVSLLSGRSRKDFSKALAERCGTFDWITFETYIVNESMKYLRREAPLVNLNTHFTAKAVEYLIYPILPKNSSIVIYCAGGKLKSYLALFMGCLVQFGISNNNMGWQVTQGNVLYLDWEEPDKDAAIQRKRLNAILKALDVADNTEFFYMPCSRSFIDLLPQIKRVVKDRKIDLVIIDSQMAATAGNANYPADIVASLFYNAINSLRITALIIDHVTKEDMRNNGEIAPAAYGSIVKYNRARVQYALETSEVSPTEFECSLIRKKNNNIPKIKPIGIRVEFDDDANGVEQRTFFKLLDLEKSAALFQTMTPVDKIKTCLRRGAKTIRQISEETALNKNTVNGTLRRSSAIFTKSNQKSGKEDLWGLADTDHQPDTGV